jgi:hypothetical protein
LKTTITFIALILLFGCKNQERKKVEFTETKDVRIEKPQSESIYELIINKIEKPDNLSKKFDYSKNYTEKELTGLNLDSTKIDANEYYFLTDQKFLSEDLDGMDFKIYYQFLYGALSQKVLRIKRQDSILNKVLSATGGDGQNVYEISTEFINDSIFVETKVHKSTVVDDTYLVANQVDSIVKTMTYNQKLDFQEKKVDSFKIKNTGFVEYPIEEIGSNSQLAYKDSLALLLFWRKTAFSMLDTINSNISNSKIETLFYDYYDGRSGLNGGGVYSSPDGLFKILVVRGESCGAYCNPFWESQLILSNRKKINNLSFKNIEKIYSIPDGKYLIIEESFGRPASVFTETTKSATLLSFKEGEINYHPFNFSYPKYNKIKNDKIYNPSGKLSFSQEHFIDAEQYLTYNKETKRLKYSYGTDFSYCCQIDSAYVFKGVLEYKNGGFTLLNEKKEHIEVE